MLKVNYISKRREKTKYFGCRMEDGIQYHRDHVWTQSLECMILWKLHEMMAACTGRWVGVERSS